MKALKAQLAQRNEKPGKGINYRKLTEYTLDQLHENAKRADLKTSKEWSFGAYLLWQSLAITMNVQEKALHADRDKMRKMVGLD